MRFSERGTSCSNLPNLKFNHGDPQRLSKRTLADSNPTVPEPTSIEGTRRKEMLLARVPPVRMAMPVRSNREVLMVCSPLGAESTGVRRARANCECAVSRTAIGQHYGRGQGGAYGTCLN